MSRSGKTQRVRKAAVDSAVKTVTVTVPVVVDAKERRRFARTQLLRWQPRVVVASDLVQRYGIAEATAYDDVRAVWADVAKAQESTKEQEIARAVALLEEQIADVRGSDEPATVKAKAMETLVDRLLKIAGAYPETKRTIAATWALLARVGGDAMRTEKIRAAQLTDVELEEAIAAEQRKLGIGIGDEEVVALVAARFGDAAASAVREVGRPVIEVGVMGRAVITETGADDEE